MSDLDQQPRNLAAQIRERHVKVMLSLDLLTRRPEQNPAWVRTLAATVRQHCADMMVELAAMEASERDLVARLNERSAPASGRPVSKK